MEKQIKRASILFDFSGQVVLVTGGSSGIGLATAEVFLAAGAKVYSGDLQAPAEEMNGLNYVEVDVADHAAVKAVVDSIVSSETRIDCLINNAGISRDAVVWKMSEHQWDEVMDVNLKGAFNFIHHAAPQLRKQKHGKIVNVASINGMRGKFGLTNYAASKAGLIGLTKTVARELGRDGINVNAVAPGFVATPLMRKLPQDVLQQARSETLMNRFAEPLDIAYGIAFLCSDYAGHITGEVLKIDGGQYI